MGETQDINDVLKENAVVVEDWSYRDLARLLYEWADRFNKEFELGLDTPALQIERIRAQAIGSYRPGRNGFGLHHEVTFNTKHLDRPVAEILETLLHELLHEWQQIYSKPGKGNYHNRQYQEKAQSFGLIVDSWGHSLGVAPGPFTDLLKRHGVDATVLPLPGEDSVRSRPRGESKMKKWVCRCMTVRAAKELEAQCLKCGGLFHRADPTW